MDHHHVCGTCQYGGEAYDRYGNLDPNYVICQIKEAENRQRKPDRFQTSSAVSRMHYHRDACLYWKARPPEVGEQPLPQIEAEEATLRPLWQQAPNQNLNPPILSPDDEELKRLKLQVIQQDQMLTALRNQTFMLSEQVNDLQEALSTAEARLERLLPFDVALQAELNYFALLGVSEKASDEEIKEAYRQRMKQFHPDRFLNLAQRINIAYETLIAPDKRIKYLQQIRK